MGADVFFREVQVAWDELFPFADHRTMESAKKLGLSADVDKLVHLVGDSEFPRLVAALVRVRLEDGYEAVLEEAGNSG